MAIRMTVTVEITIQNPDEPTASQKMSLSLVYPKPDVQDDADDADDAIDAGDRLLTLIVKDGETTNVLVAMVHEMERDLSAAMPQLLDRLDQDFTDMAVDAEVERETKEWRTALQDTLTMAIVDCDKLPF